MSATQKMYYNMDEKFPAKYAKGGAVKTTGGKGVKTSSKTLEDERVPNTPAPKAPPRGRVMEDKKGGRVHKAMGGPIGDKKDEALPEGKVMNKAKGGAVDKRLGKC